VAQFARAASTVSDSLCCSAFEFFCNVGLLSSV